ncbi:sialoadhesin-like [Sardina pilchardus]|uniref:sialoadhesin-like n=1 Tax=Sardina pilchardus TaxID=27697 RepID=UPI002E117907
MPPKILWVLFGGLVLTIPGSCVSDGLQVARPLPGEVTYSSPSVCVLQGTSVVLTCYTPRNQTVWSTFWFSPKLSGNWWSVEQPEDLLLEPEFAGRVAYSRTGDRSSTLTITDLRLSDSGVYRCLFISDQGTHSDSTGVNVTVTGLQVRMSADNVSEGQKVTLTCSTTCTLSNNPTYIWYKSGNHISHTHTTRSNRLDLMSVSREDGGNYSCAVKGHDHLPSSAVTLSISHSGSENQPAVYASVGILLVLLLAVSLTNPPVRSSASTKVEDLEDENNIQYSSIQFRHPNKPNSNLQPAQSDDSGVLYASVRVPSTELV